MSLLRRIAKKAKSEPPALVAMVGDLHVNSTTGLPPGLSFPLDDGGTYRASKTQRWLLDAWLNYWSIIDARQKEHGAELFVIINGDIVDGDHHDTRQIITRNETTQGRMAVHILDPVAQRCKPDHLFVTRGTSSHVGHCAAWDEKIAEDLGAHPARRIDDLVVAWSHWYLKVAFRGVKFDVMHHTTRSKVPRSKGASAGRLAADTQGRYIDRGEWPPDLVVRSHVHVSEDSDDNHRTRAIILPCWQGPTEYGHTIAPGDWPTIGGAWALCQDGGYHLEIERYPYKEEQQEWIEF